MLISLLLRQKDEFGLQAMQTVSLALSMSCAQLLGGRNQQEDSLFCGPVDHADGQMQLAVVADGMGGYAGGDMASKLAVDAMTKVVIQNRDLPPDELLESGLQAANDSIAEFIRNQPQYLHMGTTLLAALQLEQRLWWVSVGDSYLYLLRGGELQLLNELHSYAETLRKHVEKGHLSASVLRDSALKHVLTSSVSGQEIAMINRSPGDVFELQPGDCLLLATDGIESISTETLTAILSDSEDHDPARTIIDAVEAAHQVGQDNTSTVVLRIPTE